MGNDFGVCNQPIVLNLSAFNSVENRFEIGLIAAALLVNYTINHTLSSDLNLFI
jgi:hypothetical protein